jgi:hypothetical protein
MQNKNMLASIFLLFAGFVSMAQAPGVPTPPPPTPPPGTPIDGGLIVLFAVALVYGVYKIIKITKRIAE